jgi:hypothetical protein
MIIKDTNKNNNKNKAPKKYMNPKDSIIIKENKKNKKIIK